MDLPECDCCGYSITSNEFGEWWNQFVKGFAEGSVAYTYYWARSVTKPRKVIADEVFSHLTGTESNLDKKIEDMDDRFDKHLGEEYYWEETENGVICPHCNPDKEPAHNAISCQHA